MFLTLSDRPQAGGNTSEAFRATVTGAVMGSLPLSHVTLSKEQLEPSSVPVSAWSGDMVHDTGASVLLIAFQLDQGTGEPEVRRYAEARAPALAKHGGKVLLSGLTPRLEGWQFDGVELIQFPAPETIRSLMVDPDYKNPHVQELSKIFAGNIAVLHLAVSL